MIDYRLARRPDLLAGGRASERRWSGRLSALSSSAGQVARTLSPAAHLALAAARLFAERGRRRRRRFGV